MARKSKPISFISWNTDDFLKNKCDSLVDNNTVVFYMFIKHFAEDDETRDHKHLFVIPNGTIDTDSFRDLFDEFDPNKPDKPIRLSPYKPSKFLDAYLYFLHDINYLANIGQSRRFHYLESDFVTSDRDYLHELYLTSDKSKINGSKVKIIAEAIYNQIDFVTLVEKGQIPIQQINQYWQVYELLSQKKTFRNGRKGHDDGG